MKRTRFDPFTCRLSALSLHPQNRKVKQMRAEPTNHPNPARAVNVLEITRAQFATQLPEIGWFYKTKEAQAESLALWDHLLQAQERATLYIRGYEEGFGCYMASLQQTGFYNYYLPICARLAKPAR